MVPFTTRYELEKRHNIELMAHYGEEAENIEDSVSTDTDDENTDSNDGNQYFEPKPRRINFDDLELGYENNEMLLEDNEANKQNTKKSLDDGAYKKFVCDICSKMFQKRWFVLFLFGFTVKRTYNDNETASFFRALNSHMLLHSGFVILINF